jgi:hypothetical protein
MIDIKDFLVNILKDRIDSNISLHTGRQDEEKSLLILNNNNQANFKLYNQNYFKQNIQIVINWNDNYTETRQKALEIYNVISNIDKVEYDEHTMIIDCSMFDDFPQDNTNNSKIYSQRFNFQIRYIVF